MPDEQTDYAVGQVYDIPLSQIVRNENQPRKTFDPESLEALQLSIERDGLLQPIALIKAKDGTFIIAAGERRFKAVAALGWKTIPGRIVEGNLDDLAVVENMIREDLNPMERAIAMQSYLEKHKLSRKQLANIFGIARNTISEILSLNRLPQDIQDIIIRDKHYSLHNMRVIARIRDNTEQREKFNNLRIRIEKCSQPSKKETKKSSFILDNKRDRLKKIILEIKNLHNQFSKTELKKLQKEIVDLYDQLEALCYKIDDDIVLRR